MSSPDYKGFAQRVREAMEDEGYGPRFCDCDDSVPGVDCLYCEAVALSETPNETNPIPGFFNAIREEQRDRQP